MDRLVQQALQARRVQPGRQEERESLALVLLALLDPLGQRGKPDERESQEQGRPDLLDPPAPRALLVRRGRQDRLVLLGSMDLLVRPALLVPQARPEELVSQVRPEPRARPELLGQARLVLLDPRGPREGQVRPDKLV
jgi:hypothetical protein